MSDPQEQKICRMCGGRCCQYPMTQLWLKPGEDALFKDTCLPFHPRGDGSGNGFVDFRDSPDKRCPHLRDGRCSIYRKRPFNCKGWPFLETDIGGCMLVAWRRGFGTVRAYSQ